VGCRFESAAQPHFNKRIDMKKVTIVGIDVDFNEVEDTILVNSWYDNLWFYIKYYVSKLLNIRIDMNNFDRLMFGIMWGMVLMIYIETCF